MRTANRHILRSLLHAIVFVEFSGDTSIDPDAAVGLLEAIDYELQKMSPEDRLSFAADLIELSSEYSGKEREFISRLSQSFGLLNEAKD